VERLSRLDVLSAAELEQRKDALAQELAQQQARLEQERGAAGQVLQQEIAQLTQQRNDLFGQLHQLRQEVVATEEEAVLQEVGVYRYRHPLSDAVAYQADLARLRDRIKTMTRKDGGAVLGSTSWHVNGSLPQGRAMVRDFSKLMLRAYNAEADNLVRGMKPYKLDSAIDRLTKVANTILKLGRTMDIHISQDYHALRVTELELTADYLELQAQQKEREREERERLREEKRVQQEMQRERDRLEKERQHHANALAALEAKGDEEAASRLREQLEEIDHRIEDVDYRAANIRAGYVYVISNLGSFGEQIVKIGLTRRLEPRDRIRELGDASVPFRFDTHALFFSKDAVGIEAELHRRLADRRVNLVNTRREFFYTTPAEVKKHLLELTGELLEYEDLPEAVEYRQSAGQRAG
jgi:seryl-tRNA synthetase